MHKDIINELSIIKEYGIENKIPIIEDEGLQLLLKICKDKKPNNILEIGTAIGYSAINMYLQTNANITTIERNEELFKIAKNNVKKLNLENCINLINEDALLFDNSKLNKFDIIYIDAAKAQNKNFLDKYIINLNDNGIVIFDNLFFHDYVFKKQEEIESKNLRQLIRKLKEFNAYLSTTTDYDVKIYNEGDGIGVLKLKNDQ